MAMIETVNLTKKYGELTALDNLNLKIEQGSCFGFIGPNGAGTTTTIKILATLLKPSWGEARIDGKTVGYQNALIRPVIGYVPDFMGAYDDMLVQEYLEFFASCYGIHGDARRKAVAEVLELTDLTGKTVSEVNGLSRGMQQRLSVARVLLHDPKVLLLDEPLSALDAKVRDSLREEIRRVQREIGVTTLFVTHDQHEALAIADRVGVMSHGRLEQIDPPRSLYEQPDSAFVAGFVGTVNRIPAEADGDRWRVLNRSVPGTPTAPGATLAAIRPEHIAVDVDASGNDTVREVVFLGPLTRLTVDHGGSTLIADLLTSEFGGAAMGDRVRVRLRDDVDEIVLIED